MVFDQPGRATPISMHGWQDASCLFLYEVLEKHMAAEWQTWIAISQPLKSTVTPKKALPLQEKLETWKKRGTRRKRTLAPQEQESRGTSVEN